MAKKLTEKQKAFCDEYLIKLNATRAYLTVYTNAKDEKSAAPCACRLMKNENVAAYIDKRIKERQKRTAVTQDRVVTELAAIGFAVVTDYAKVVKKTVDTKDQSIVVSGVEIDSTDSLSKEQQKALAHIKQTNSGVEIKLHDKVKALELLGRHLGMFKEKLDVGGVIVHIGGEKNIED